MTRSDDDEMVNPTYDPQESPSPELPIPSAEPQTEVEQRIIRELNER